MKRLRVFDVRIPFNFPFRHATAVRSSTESVWVEVTDASGAVGLGEACQRAYVTGESVATCAAFLREVWTEVVDLDDVAALEQYVADHRPQIDRNPAAWCALELALLDLMGRRCGRSIEALLGLPGNAQFRYSAVLGDSGTDAFAGLYRLYRERGLTDFKVKLSGDLDAEGLKLTCMLDGLGHIRVRADANNLWSTVGEATAYLSALGFPFYAIEEPLAAGCFDALAAVSQKAQLPIVLDESFLRLDQIEALRQDPQRWIVNARVSKLGGLLRTLEVLRSLRSADIPIIVGAQVGETGLLTRAGCIAAEVAGDGLVAHEGAFSNYLLADDPFEPRQRFTTDGVLSREALEARCRPGSGLHLTTMLGSDARFKRVF
jgi:L-alanine-DL-glutamate epimerase-like enolase superfamily enzyme